ncbi:MAG: c-type cytochrome [Chloroflexota bacterium]
MTLPAWLRFAELSLLAGWAIWQFYRPTKSPAAEALLPALVAVVSLGQLMLEAQSATDPFTPLTQMLPIVLASPYGALSAAIFVLGLAVALWLWRTKTSRVRPVAGGAALILLAWAGGSAAGAPAGGSAAASTGELAMSPTLAVPRSTLTTPNPYANDPASAERGRFVYQQYCQACHGLNGDGNGPAVAGLRVRPPSFRNPQHFLAPGMDGAHFWVVQHGDGRQGGMPSWQGTLSDQQIWDAVNYVKEIAAGQANAAPAVAKPTAS